MRDTGDVFHLAIPVSDLNEAQAFYVDGLGCKLARRYADRITLEFFGAQVVCHLSDRIDSDPTLYPRHFGVTFRDRDDFDRLRSLVDLRKLAIFQDVRCRFDGMAEAHFTFVIRDPSNNLIEFKYYLDPRMMY